MMKAYRLLPVAAAALLFAAVPAVHAQQAVPLDSAFMANFEWREIGPANMMGRVTDIEGLPSPSKTFYFAAAAGGIWKTTNNGITFKQIFDDERVISMGDLAIAPSDSNIIWAGTGEEDSRNSISPGGGIFKSTDGGESWEMMGLEETQAIGRIVVHPTDPNVVYVAALGAPWNENPERGLYRTRDGGESWELVKFISDRAGFVDIAMDPRDPNVLWASSWERIRTPYSLQSGGPGSGLWKTTDGGDNWTEVTGGGFPETTKGRIGIAISQSNPDVMYAIVEADGPTEEDDNLSGLYRSNDSGATWERMNERNVRPFYYSQVRVDPEDPDRVYWSSTPVNFSKDGGTTVGTTTNGIHVDHHAMWIDPNDGNRFVTGNDGGIAITFDRGGSYEFPNIVPIGQFYEISYNMDMPYRVCGGLQDNGTWCGPSRVSNGGITNHHWYTINGGDGFYAQQDPVDPAIVYAESQGGNVARINLETGERTGLRKPNWRDRYRIYEDSVVMALPDTTEEPSAEVAERIQDLRRQAARDSAAFDMRFNWNTPIVLSPHDRNVLYVAGNRVLKSEQRGDSLRIISPDLSRQDTMKIRISTSETGGVTPDVTGAETFATIVSLAESPLREGMVFAGTDDGNLWITRDGGDNWEDLTANLAGTGVPDGTYVVRIEPSHFDENRFYVAFDGHRTGDYAPHVVVTNDGGRSFESIADGLPTGSVDFLHVVREDPVNENLLFVGSDVGVYMSMDRGQSWQRFMHGLPTVPVHDLQIHPRDSELIAGTHGRAVWIVDILPLQQMPNVSLDEVVFFEPRPGLQYGMAPIGGESTGHQWFEAESANYGAEFSYYVPASAAAPEEREEREEGAQRGQRGNGEDRPQAQIAILSPSGDTVQTLNGPMTEGLHRVYWNLRERPEPEELSPSERRDSARSIVRVHEVADSMIAAGADRQAVEEVVAAVESGDVGALRRSFFRGGGGGGVTDPERPGESYPREPAGGQQAERDEPAGGEEDPGEVAREMFDVLRDYAETLRSGYNPLGGGGFFGGGGVPFAEPGTYTVSVKVGDTEVRQDLRVERRPGFPADPNSVAGLEEWQYDEEWFEEHGGVDR